MPYVLTQLTFTGEIVVLGRGLELNCPSEIDPVWFSKVHQKTA